MKYRSGSPEATETLGEKLGRLLLPGDIVALIGDLGTGKTRLTHGIARGVGLKPGQSVNSPSYVLINEYQADRPVYHIDLYRITHASDLFDLGLEEYLLGNGICVIEWADRVLEWLPEEHLRVHLEWVGENERDFVIEPLGTQLTQRLQAMGTMDEDPCG